MARDRELHAPALRQRECGDVAGTPAGRLPDDQAATSRAERGQQVLRRAGRGARGQHGDRPAVWRTVRARRNRSRLRSVPRGSGVAQVPCPEHGPVLGRSPAHRGERAVGEAGEDLVRVFRLAVRGAAQVEHQRLDTAEVGKRAVELAHDVFVRQGGDTHDGDAARQRLRGERRRVERPAVVEGEAARDAETARLGPRYANQQMDGGALVALEHPRGGALPAVGRGGGRDLRQH